MAPFAEARPTCSLCLCRTGRKRMLLHADSEKRRSFAECAAQAGEF